MRRAWCAGARRRAPRPVAGLDRGRGGARADAAELRERLRAMADRIRGADAIAMRGREIPHAHRVFFRHVGLDPDVVRTPVEAIVLRRLQQGGLRPQGLIPDALTVATLETGVGVWAFDAAALVGALGSGSTAAGW